jgi:hypothetical protein
VETVVVEQDTRGAVDVGVGVLGLAVLLEDLRGDAAVLLDELEDGVVGDLGTRGGVVHEGFEAGIGLAQDGVAVAGDDAAGVESGPEIVVDVLLGVVGGDGFLHLDDPSENLLSGETSNMLVQITAGEREMLTREEVQRDPGDQHCKTRKDPTVHCQPSEWHEQRHYHPHDHHGEQGKVSEDPESSHSPFHPFQA